MRGSGIGSRNETTAAGILKVGGAMAHVNVMARFLRSWLYVLFMSELLTVPCHVHHFRQFPTRLHSLLCTAVVREAPHGRLVQRPRHGSREMGIMPVLEAKCFIMMYVVPWNCSCNSPTPTHNVPLLPYATHEHGRARYDL